MSKNITIQEGGVAKQLTVDKLKTNLVGSGTCLWVPEDEVQLTTKTITANGTYKASDDGYYGYSEVTVNGVGSATGTDGDGDEATVTTGGGGELVTTKIPSSIKVTTLPNKTAYIDQQAIDYTGMVVKAYLKTGGLYGTVPSGELLLPTKTATYDSDTSGSATSDVQGALTQPISFSSGSLIVRRDYEDYEYFNIEYTLTQGNMRVIGKTTGTELILYFVSDSPFNGSLYLRTKKNPTAQAPNPQEDYRWMGEDFVGALRTVHGKAVYVSSKTVLQLSSIADPGCPTYTETPNDNDFYTIVYGDVIMGSINIIPVLWDRPGDGSTLETNFTITVTQS